MNIPMTINNIMNSILQTTEKFNFGSTLFTLLPWLIFIFYSFRLSQLYILSTYMNPIDQDFHHNIPGNGWWKFILKNTLVLILVWSSSQCWSDGLIRFLEAYTLHLILMINNCLKNNYRMNHTTLIALEYYSKMIVCYSVVYFMHWCCRCITKNNQYRMVRRSRRRQLNDWPIGILRIDDLDELGENGYLLMQNIVPPEFDNSLQFMNNNNSIQLKQTQSCPMFVKKTKKSLKRNKRHKSLGN